MLNGNIYFSLLSMHTHSFIILIISLSLAFLSITEGDEANDYNGVNDYKAAKNDYKNANDHKAAKNDYKDAKNWPQAYEDQKAVVGY